MEWIPRTYRLMLLLAFSIICIVMSGHPQAKVPTVVDVSWPNCSYRPQGVFGLGIVGVTGGLDFRSNPCAATETGWMLHAAAYMNTGYPGMPLGQRFALSPRRCRLADEICGAYNYGYQAARYALGYAASEHLFSPVWWLDVETENSWSADPAVNREVLRGMVAAIHDEAFYAAVGFYSTPRQ